MNPSRWTTFVFVMSNEIGNHGDQKAIKYSI